LRILIISLYYKPEPGGHFFSNIAEKWAKEGHEIEILSCRPYLTDFGVEENFQCISLNGVTVNRLPVNILFQKKVIFKALNLIKFCVYALIWSLRKPKYDLIMTSSLTPIFMAIVCRIVCKIKGSKFVYRIMDIHPEVWRYSGSFKNKLILKLLEKIEIGNCRAANELVTLSEDMVKTISDRDKKNNLSINIIRDGLPNAVADGKINYIKELENKTKFRIVYTGNIGRFQKLETVISAFHKIPEEIPIELVIVGKGLQEESLKLRADKLLNKSIKFIDFQNSITLNSIIKSADLGLVSLLNGVERCAFPSKMFHYLDLRCPVLAIMDDCFLTNFIEKNDIGYSVPQDDVDSISSKLVELSNIKDLKETKRNQIEKVLQNYSNNSILEQWSDLLKKLN